jgi:hypothetical protein
MNRSVLEVITAAFLLLCYYYILIRLLTAWIRVLLEKLTVLQLVKKFPAFYGTLSSINALTVPATCLYPEPAQSSPYPTFHFLKIHLNIILPSTPGPPHWSLYLRFPHQILVHVLLCYSTCIKFTRSSTNLFQLSLLLGK